MILLMTSALLLASQLVSAMPFYQVARSVPSDVAHIAYDNASGKYIAYNRDGSMYGTYSHEVPRDVNHYKRDSASSCTRLASQEVSALPGWAQIEQYAKSQWGTGNHQTVTNPAAFLDQPATACVGGSTVAVEVDGSPTCISDSAETEGKLTGTSGSVTLGFQQGFNNSASWTVTKSSSFGVSVSVSAEFGIPDIGGVSTSVSTSTEFNNSVSQGFSTSVSNMATQQLTLNAPDGSTCSASFNLTTCNTQGSGKVRYLASGWVWYMYNKKTQGHFDWAVNMDAILPNEDDRSSYMEFTGSMKGISSSNFVGNCDQPGCGGSG